MVDVAVVTLLCATLGILSVRQPLDLQDESVVVVYADQILAGRWPHADFFTVYGPGTFAVVAAAFHTLGSSVEVERLVGLAYHVLLAVGVLRLTRPWGRRPSLTAAMTCVLVLVPLGLIAYAWLGGLALVIWELAVLSGARGRRSAVAAGVLAGLVPLMRPEMLVLAVVCAVPLLRRRTTPAFVAGVLGGLLPALGYAVYVGPRWFENIVLNRLAVDARIDLDQIYVGAYVNLAVSCAAAGVVAAVAVRTRERRWAACALLGVLVLPQSFQRVDVDHAAFSLGVTLPLCLVAGLTSVRATNRPSVRVWVPRLLAVVTVPALVVTGASVLQRPAPDTRHVVAAGASTIVPADRVNAIQAALARIHEVAPAGSTVFVGATDMATPTLTDVGLYHLLGDYRADSYYLELPPGVAERPGSGLAQDVLRADLLILGDVPAEDSHRLAPHLGRGSDEANDAVARFFCPRDTTALGTLYTRCR